MEEYKVGDEVKCINDGKSEGLGELYYKGIIYTISHLFLSDNLPTIGLKGYRNICKASDFKLLNKEEEILNNIEIW